MGIKNISVGNMHLGTWSFDCHTMRSKILPPQRKPFFKLEVAVGGVVATAVQAVLAGLGGAGSGVGDSIARSAPGFSGKIEIELEAVRALVFCDEDKDHAGKQAVGWDYLFTVALVGSLNTGAASVAITVVLPIAVTGDRQWCDCNAEIDIDKLMSALPQRSPDESTTTISTQGATYSFLAEPSHVRALAMASVESELNYRAAVRSAARETARGEPVVMEPVTARKISEG
jgi:hypothetical protein